MTAVREPAEAGRFYPEDPSKLLGAVQGYLAEARPSDIEPKALIVPHAGYIYSGPVAASAYACLTPLRERITRVLLFGPAHRVGFEGLALSSVDSFQTPMGEVRVDRKACEQITALPDVQVYDAAHDFEYSLEVHLPFLMEMLDDFAIVPVVVGQARPESVKGVIDELWGGPETLIVVSSDLSHGLEYGTARGVDDRTTEAIENLRPDDIGHQQACGSTGVKALLAAAREHGLKARTLDLRNSGDTAGPRDRVVGYGAYVFA